MTAAPERLLKIEVDATEARRLAGRLRFACLPSPATLAEFDYDAQPGVDPHLIADLATCRYLSTATNVLMIGPPGVGKTYLAVGLARQAAEVGYRVYVTTAADLAARCHRAAIEGRWATTMRFFAGPTLLVIDELGYLPLPAEGASALFLSAVTCSSVRIVTPSPSGARRCRASTVPVAVTTSSVAAPSRCVTLTLAPASSGGTERIPPGPAARAAAAVLLGQADPARMDQSESGTTVVDLSAYAAAAERRRSLP